MMVPRLLNQLQLLIILACLWLLLSTTAPTQIIETETQDSVLRVSTISVVPSSSVLDSNRPQLQATQQQLLISRAWPREGNLCHAQGPYLNTDIPRFVWQKRRCRGAAQRWWADYCYPGIQYVRDPRPPYTEFHLECPRDTWCWNLSPDDHGHYHIACRPVDPAFNFANAQRWQVDPDDDDHARQGSWTILRQQQLERQRQRQQQQRQQEGRLSRIVGWLSGHVGSVVP